MKHAGIIVCLSAMLAVCAAGATNGPVQGAAAGEERTYLFKPGHLTLTVPADWTMVPQKELLAYQEKLRELFPKRPVPNYVLAFQRKALFTFSLPYVLIEIEERMMPAVEEVEQEAVRFDESVRSAYLDLHRSGQFGEVRALPAAYDPTNHVIVGYSQMTRAEDKQKIAAVTAIYPCRYGYLRMYFFVAADEQERDIPDVESILASVTFERDYRYIAQRASSGLSRGARYTLYTVVVVLATLWFIMRVISRRTRSAP